MFEINKLAKLSYNQDNPKSPYLFSGITVFSFTGSAAITSILLSVFIYKLVFSEQLQVKVFHENR
ncbi:hypothetical protein D3C84_1185880 [compost metagenome]